MYALLEFWAIPIMNPLSWFMITVIKGLISDVVKNDFK